MTFSIKAIIRAFVAPNHRIRCLPNLWNALLGELDRRGERRHETGAFLLGTISGGTRKIVDVVYYDELDPAAYESGVCILHGDAFSRLWAICRERGLTVVADVHTHPGGAGQSWSDKRNPMVARAGHVAFIVPNFSRAPVSMLKIGIYQYRGDHQWTDRSRGSQSHFFYNGIWS
jgi:proteasome lid subunit RPN8/RPN11